MTQELDTSTDKNLIIKFYAINLPKRILQTTEQQRTYYYLKRIDIRIDNTL